MSLDGIVLIDNFPFRLTATVDLKRGDGSVYLSGSIDPNVEEVINYGISFAARILELEDLPFPDLSRYDLRIRLRTPACSTPVVGPSYGLLLCLQIIFALKGDKPILSAAVTGAVDADGSVLSVGGVPAKRKGAKELGYTHLILPSNQLDFFDTNIVQVPVSSIFEAYVACCYGKT